MADFFDRLLERNRGAVQEIRPRPRARFEPDNRAAVLDPVETEALAFSGPHREPTFQPVHPLNHTKISTPQSVIEPMQAPTDDERIITHERTETSVILPPMSHEVETPTHRPAVPMSEIQPRANTQPVLQTEPSLLATPPRTLPADVEQDPPFAQVTMNIRQEMNPLLRPEAPPRDSSDTGRTMILERAAIPARPVQTRLIQHVEMAAPETIFPVVEPPVSAPPPSPPRIHVTIGRIEIRAITAPPSVKPAPARKTGMSLDEYLRQRERGTIP